MGLSRDIFVALSELEARRKSDPLANKVFEGLVWPRMVWPRELLMYRGAVDFSGVPKTEVQLPLAKLAKGFCTTKVVEDGINVIKQDRVSRCGGVGIRVGVRDDL